jgi:hypothetical protein
MDYVTDVAHVLILTVTSIMVRPPPPPTYPISFLVTSNSQSINPTNQQTGDWKDGVRDGEGTLKQVDGTRYVGQWSNDKQNGEGTIYYQGDEEPYRGMLPLSPTLPYIHTTTPPQRQHASLII